MSAPAATPPDWTALLREADAARDAGNWIAAARGYRAAAAGP